MSGRIPEALVNGVRSFSDVGDLVRRALRARLLAQDVDYCWVWVVDLTGTDVVYETDTDQLWQCGYTLADDGTVTLGEPVKVARTYVALSVPQTAGAGATSDDAATAVMSALESAQRGERDHLVGRVLEAKGSSVTGGRCYAVRIINTGDSLNGNRYPEGVLAAAAALYEGAKAYNRHRNAEDINSGTIEGLVGTYRNVTVADDGGLDAELHLFPSAVQTAEALDAALHSQAAGLPPTVGISHDVLGTFKQVTENGKTLREATAITHVFSADVVSEPAAGGKATRVVAGGIHLDLTQPTERVGENSQEIPTMQLTTEAVLEALKNATPEQLAAAQLQRAGETAAPEKPAEQAAPAAAPAEQTFARESWTARRMVADLVATAGLPDSAADVVRANLPEQGVTESSAQAAVRAYQDTVAAMERAGLAPRTAETQVTSEARDKKVEALEQLFDTSNGKGYPTLREAFVDWTGARRVSFDEDFNRRVLAESFGHRRGARASESLDSTSWAQVLGDVLNKRLLAEYGAPQLQSWRKIVSGTPRINDFREQKISRVGGYGTLSAVGEGAPYQPLTSPGDEEARYSISKRGGTEDLTLEMIANDDVRALANIPKKLGRAAAITLYRFVWDILPTNAATSYDSVALFHASHGNTTAAALSQSAMTTIRKNMRRQAAYGDSVDILSLVPRLLVVPSALEEMAKKITGARAVPSTGEGASDMANLHEGMEYVVIDYYSDENDWFAFADPTMCPTIEVGFYLGREEPELFSQVDPNLGSVFDADKITWKIRHIYGSTVLDHRGMQRGTA